MPFTERDAKAARWEGKDRLVSAGDGLYLNVRRASKTWLIRRTVNGKMRVRTLGHYPAMPTKQARAAAMTASLSTPSAMTVSALSEAFFSEVVQIDQKRPELVRGYLDRAIIPQLGSRRVAELTPGDIATVIQGYRERGPRTADQLRSILKSLLTFAIEIGVRPDNPAASLTRRVAGYRPEARARVLSDVEIRKLWSVDHPNGRLLRFLLLTGLRISEAQKGARDGDLWRVAAEISKNGAAHWVYLTASALDQLPMPANTATGVQSWLRRWCEREGIADRFTPHDMRRTAATRMADAGVAPFVVERVLNHTLQGVMAVYNRADYAEERIAAAQTLERSLLTVAG
jgi:integrase